VSETDETLVQVFRDEVEERLDSFVGALLAAENGQGTPETIDVLFREAHTIKGAAGMLGFDHVRELAHAAEDLLAPARAERIFPVELVAPLLRVADTIRLGVDGDAGACAELAEELRGLASGATDPMLEARVEEPEAPEAPEAPEPERVPPPKRTGDGRSVRVPAEKIDRLLDLVGETVLHQRRLEHELEPGDKAELAESLSDELDVGARLVDDLKTAAIGMRTRPLSTIVGSLPRAVRDIAAELGKDVELVVHGAEVELDRIILESLSDPLVHLLRNAIAHGVELPAEREAAGKPARGRLELRAEQRGPTVEITVADDGRGVPEKALEEARRVGSLVDVLARPGFSTAGAVSEIAGRGVGLDAVKVHADTFGGSLEVRSEPGAGTEIVLRLPLALALLDVLLVERHRIVYGIPLGAVDEVLASDDTMSLVGRRALNLRGQPVPLEDLADLRSADAPALPERSPAVVVASGGRRVAVRCDRLIGEEEVLLGTMSPLLGGIEGYLGTAILGDGTIALVLEPAALTRGTTPTRRVQELEQTSIETPKVLVVEDSFTVRELQRSILEAAGYRVETARDGREALARVASNGIDLVVTDVEMPELDGLALTRAIRADAEHSSLPVVVVSSRGSDEDRQAGIDAGADAYIAKLGYDQHALLETVERLVGR
jgi:two-component system chemotaxis sensor kinase CheA